VILIGQYDSPFVRRVGIALTLYEMPFEHQLWSAFKDAGRLRELNPLCRVPTLVLDDGTVLVDSHAMLDYLDGLVPAGRAMFPQREPERYRALRVATLATGLGDKAVSLFYEIRMHSEVSRTWVDRCRSQILSTLAALETERAGISSDYWFGGHIGHADIAVATVLRFVGEAHPGLAPIADFPALAAHAARLEALPVFRQVAQTFKPPS
jgi:glutathione S-transferase